jgi:hypothetical protein
MLLALTAQAGPLMGPEAGWSLPGEVLSVRLASGNYRDWSCYNIGLQNGYWTNYGNVAFTNGHWANRVSAQANSSSLYRSPTNYSHFSFSRGISWGGAGYSGIASIGDVGGGWLHGAVNSGNAAFVARVNNAVQSPSITFANGIWIAAWLRLGQGQLQNWYSTPSSRTVTATNTAVTITWGSKNDFAGYGGTQSFHSVTRVFVRPVSTNEAWLCFEEARVAK